MKKLTNAFDMWNCSIVIILGARPHRRISKFPPRYKSTPMRISMPRWLRAVAG